MRWEQISQEYDDTQAVPEALHLIRKAIIAQQLLKSYVGLRLLLERTTLGYRCGLVFEPKANPNSYGRHYEHICGVIRLLQGTPPSDAIEGFTTEWTKQINVQKLSKQNL